MPKEAEILDFFFTAKVNGWASPNVKKTALPGMPGYKAIEFVDGDFHMMDTYCKAQGGIKSSGTTTIWHQNHPVWVMHYIGEYPPEAIAIVKEALIKAYSSHMFIGGRGVRTLKNNSEYRYENNVTKNEFSDFSGIEKVIDMKGRIVGFHEYLGRILI